MDAASEALRECHRLLTRCGGKHVVAVSRKHGLDHVSHTILILHEQDGFRSARHGASLRCFHRLSRLIGGREIDAKGSSLARFRVNRNVATALLNDSVASGKPEAG